MFDVGGPELLLILVAAILLFGPKKIPEISQMLGKGVQKIRNAQSQFQEQIKDIEKEVKSSVDLDTDKPNRPPPKEITEKYQENAQANEEIPENDYGFDKYYAKNKNEKAETNFQPKKPKHIGDEDEEVKENTKESENAKE